MYRSLIFTLERFRLSCPPMAMSVRCSPPPHTVHARSPLRSPSRNLKDYRHWDLVVRSSAKIASFPAVSSSPVESLRSGHWVKLICGASFEDAVDVRNLSLIYTLAGVDCIDCAADESIVNAVSEGIEVAREITRTKRPWVMISVNDDQDTHFRKAEFDPEICPSDCSRPCETVCPARAISLEKGGVLTDRCYGCGRCFPTCPYDRISAITYIRDAKTTSQLLKRTDVNAIEIHTSARKTDSFEKLWRSLAESINSVELVAVSLPDVGDFTVPCMNSLYSIMKSDLQCYNLWQLDGRPMSGDIGRGATRETIAFASELVKAEDRPYGFVQLAGGTNAHTVDLLNKLGLLRKMTMSGNSDTKGLNTRPAIQRALISGIAYGSYARKIVGRVLHEMQNKFGITHVEDHPESLLAALKEAIMLVGPLKCYDQLLLTAVGGEPPINDSQIVCNSIDGGVMKWKITGVNEQKF